MVLWGIVLILPQRHRVSCQSVSQSKINVLFLLFLFAVVLRLFVRHRLTLFFSRNSSKEEAYSPTVATYLAYYKVPVGAEAEGSTNTSL
jgi:hypothetical protein